MSTGGIEPQINRPQQSLIRRIAASFRPYRSQITIVGLLILFTAGLGVVNPLLIRVIFDSALFPESGSPNLNLLWIIAGVMAGITAVTSAIGIVQTYVTNQVGQKVMRDLRDRIVVGKHQPVREAGVDQLLNDLGAPLPVGSFRRAAAGIAVQPQPDALVEQT